MGRIENSFKSGFSHVESKTGSKKAEKVVMIRRLRLLLGRNIIKETPREHCFFCAPLERECIRTERPSTRYGNNIDEQMAEMQVQVRYGGFLGNLSDSRRGSINSAITAVFVNATKPAGILALASQPHWQWRK